jgi:uncharacterized membrane protein
MNTDVMERENQASAPAPAVHSGEGIKIVRACTINQPADVLFQFWRQLENLPRILIHLVSVMQTSPTESHWVAKKGKQKTIEWDAVIINEHPGELIAWQTREGSDIAHAGSVRFHRAPGNQGTEVTVALEYSPSMPQVAKLAPKLFGKFPGLQIEADLLRFKALMETGEIPTIMGQSVGSNQKQEEQ